MTKRPARTRTVVCPNCQGDKNFIVPAYDLDNPLSYDRLLGEDGIEYAFYTCPLCEGEGTIKRRIKHVR